MAAVLRQCLATLRGRLVDCTLEDFGWDNSVDFTLCRWGVGPLAHTVQIGSRSAVRLGA